LSKQVESEILYWKEILIRIIGTIKFLALRGLALRGSNEHFGVQNNGYFLGALVQVADFHSFLANHINPYGNEGKKVSSYISKTIYELLYLLLFINEIIKSGKKNFEMNTFYIIIEPLKTVSN